MKRVEVLFLKKQGPNLCRHFSISIKRLRARIENRPRSRPRQLSVEFKLDITIKQAAETPVCGSPGDQVLQLLGNVDSILRGTRALTILLRGHIIRTMLAAAPKRVAPPAIPVAAPPAIAARAPPVQLTQPPAYPPPAASNPPAAVYPPPVAYPTPAATPSVHVSLPQDVRLSINVSPTMLPTLTNMNNLQQMRQLSGAKITLKEQPTASGDREVEMSGSMAQATTAYKLIEQLLQAGAALQQQQAAAAPATVPSPVPQPSYIQVPLQNSIAPAPAKMMYAQQQQAPPTTTYAPQPLPVYQAPAPTQQQMQLQQQQLQQAAYNQVLQNATAAYNATQQSAAAAGYSQIHQQTTATAAYNQITAAAGYSQGLAAPGTATATAMPLGSAMFDPMQLGLASMNQQMFDPLSAYAQSGFQQQAQQQMFNQAPPQQQMLPVYQQQFPSAGAVKQQMSGYQQ